MEIKKIKRQIVSKLDKQNDQYEINTSEMISKLNDIDQLLDEAEEDFDLFTEPSKSCCRQC